jgi:hypothetical protein
VVAEPVHRRADHKKTRLAGAAPLIQQLLVDLGQAGCRRRAPACRSACSRCFDSSFCGSPDRLRTTRPARTSPRSSENVWARSTASSTAKGTAANCLSRNVCTPMKRPADSAGLNVILRVTSSGSGRAPRGGGWWRRGRPAWRRRTGTQGRVRGAANGGARDVHGGPMASAMSASR